jgi:hypothetical protein
MLWFCLCTWDGHDPLIRAEMGEGDVQEWLKSRFGRMIWFAGDVADGWEKKVEVADPDPESFYLCYHGKLVSDGTLCRRPRSRLCCALGRRIQQLGYRQSASDSYVQRQVTSSRSSCDLCVENMQPSLHRQHLQSHPPFAVPCLPTQHAVRNRPTYLLQ